MIGQAAGWTLETANGARRWRLNRAGIVNVYQYGNEVLDFAGGRLLLRGVNGSGKSTAMNMLLPFLLTTRERGIDAAGEQSGILRSWMLDGRDDAQPVGYLWVEFRRADEFLVCGCGIKANRQADSVNTWWFVTSKRPGVDLDLAAGGTALTAEALRAALDGDLVFTRAQRRDYRRAVEQRLFAGASIEHHVRLMNKVRNPRVGDRIDLELRDYLVDALPQVSEQALAEAAQPLDDLDEHRRSVAELARTLDAVRGLLDVYRSYCEGDLARRLDEGRERLRVRRRRDRDEERHQAEAAAAGADLRRLDSEIETLVGERRRLGREIDALKKSPAYQTGQQLEDLRELVQELSRQCSRAGDRVETARMRDAEDAREVDRARRVSLDDRDSLNEQLAATGRLARRCDLDRRPPTPVTIGEVHLGDAPTRTSNPPPVAEAVPDGGASPSDAHKASGGLGAETVLKAPAAVDLSAVGRELAAAVSAVGRRRFDVEQVQEALSVVRTAASALDTAEAARLQAADAAEHAAERLTEHGRLLAAARSEWRRQVQAWSTDGVRLLESSGVDAPATVAQAGEIPEADEAASDPEALRRRLHAEAEALVDYWHAAEGAARARLEREQQAEREAQHVVDELARRTEPEAPRAAWQRTGDWHLAEVIDFAAGLAEPQRAGLEAAMEASGLLSARLADGTLELETGELVAVASQGVTSPLSDLLTVMVPSRLAGQVDETSLLKLLASISCDRSSGAAAMVATDGEFRLGLLRGRHQKDKAQHIGATARRIALEQARVDAGCVLEEAARAVQAGREALESCRQSRVEAQQQRDGLPSTASINRAQAGVEAAAAALEEAAARREEAEAEEAVAERNLSRASDDLHRAATSRKLPKAAPGLKALEDELGEVDTGLGQSRACLNTLSRSLQEWMRACDRWRAAAETLNGELAERRILESRHADESARLATLEDSIGAKYAELAKTLDRCRAELADLDAAEPELRDRQRRGVEHKADAAAAVKVAAERSEQAEQACQVTLASLHEAAATPGYLATLRAGRSESDAAPQESPDDGVLAIAATGAEGLRQLVAALAGLAAAVDAAPAASRRSGRGATATAGPDAVHRSLLQRRDTIAGEWDPAILQPDPNLPLAVVAGPSGATLADAARAVAERHQQVAGLLDRKQEDALRQLLQGMLASEIAERIFGAELLVDLINQRLGAVTTAHRVGVRLRWRRSRELDDATRRMVELLAKRPDVRTPDQTDELRGALSRRLDEARSEHPDLPYRQLIAEALDYKQWHEMDIMVRRGADESRLGRSTPLSEGEKKLVAYLPLFAAVSASCDALAEQQSAPGGERPGIARFVLLDDAFAKVSEDNHAALFGLLVDLDLDFIATSERLWGTHSTVPDLAVTEVIRDAALQTILLEHYRWDGATLTLQDAP